jgi:hypothetical protein
MFTVFAIRNPKIRIAGEKSNQLHPLSDFKLLCKRPDIIIGCTRVAIFFQVPP